MTNQELFVELLHRLQRYDDAMVLHAVLQQYADRKEFKTSHTRISLNLLGGRVSRIQVQRALQRLRDAGFVSTRAYQNYRTMVSVDGDAVRALLATPVSSIVPGIRSDSFPFLNDCNDAAEKQAKAATNAVIKRLGQDKGNADDDSPDKPDV